MTNDVLGALWFIALLKLGRLGPFPVGFCEAGVPQNERCMIAPLGRSI